MKENNEASHVFVIVPQIINVLPRLVAGPAPEGKRPPVAAAALQSHVPDGRQTKTSGHPAGRQARGLTFTAHEESSC